MPGTPGEPEKYSIDEMMSRLTAPASEDPADGELVTRSDGSQAMKVRRRKRRSTQPHKQKSERVRRARIVQVSAALILVFISILAAGAAVAYANSKPFRDGLLKMIGGSTGTTPELMTFRMNPRTANAGSLALAWPEGNVLKDLNLRGLTAEISPTSFLGKSMSGEEVRVVEGSLNLRIPVPGEPLRSVASVDEELPVRFNRYRTPIFNLTLEGADAPILRLLKSQASLATVTSSGFPQLSLYQGQLGIPTWPLLRIDRALVEFRGEEAEFFNLRILHEIEDTGSLELSGMVFPYEPDRVSRLAVTAHGFDISGLVGPTLGHLISGKIDSTKSSEISHFSFKPAESSSPVLDLAFGVSPLSAIELSRFPFLVTLSQLLDEDDWFTKPLFESDATGVIRREKGTVSFRNLNLESKGRMTLRGDLTMAANQTLSGSFTVGIPDSMIPKASRLQSALAPADEGFRWFTLEISGTSASPADNFKELLDRPAATSAPAEDALDTGGSSFEELTRPR